MSILSRTLSSSSRSGNYDTSSYIPTASTQTTSSSTKSAETTPQYAPSSYNNTLANSKNLPTPAASQGVQKMTTSGVTSDAAQKTQQYLNDYNANREQKIRDMYASNIAAQNAQQKTAYDANANALKTAYDTNIGTQKAAYDANLGTLRTNYDESTGNLKTAYDKNTGALRTAYDDNVNNQKLLYDKSTGTLRTAYDQDVGNLGTAYEKNAGVLKTNYDENLGNLKTVYDKNTGTLKTVYDKNLASLTNAYEQNLSNAEAMRDRISPQYQQAMNALAAEYERERRNDAMRGAVNGLNTGAGSQLALGRGMAYQGNQGNLARAENEALDEANRGIYNLGRDYYNNANILETEYNNNLGNLGTEYNNNVANLGTRYNNETANLEREYQNNLATLASTFNNNQSNLDLENLNKLAALEANYNNTNANLAQEYNNNLATLGTKYSNERANLETANQNAMANLGTKYQNDFASLQQNYQNKIAEAAANNDYQMAAALLDEYGAQYDRLMDQASQLAQFGDFSMYANIYGVDAALEMEKQWVLQNPDLAYNLGKITDEDYYLMTGNYPIGVGPVSSGDDYGGTYTAIRSSMGNRGLTGKFGSLFGAYTGSSGSSSSKKSYSNRGYSASRDKAYRGPAGAYVNGVWTVGATPTSTGTTGTTGATGTYTAPSGVDSYYAFKDYQVGGRL